jgi:hypothetical protein
VIAVDRLRELLWNDEGVRRAYPEPAKRHALAARILALQAPLDLNDPATENTVAEAIARLAPEGAYVPLSQRYPWRFSEPTAGQQETTLVDAVVEALRGSAAVLKADRLSHLVPALIALAEALEHGALVPGPPPGPCEGMLQSTIVEVDGTRRPDVHFCELRAGHAGLHEEGSKHSGRSAQWSDPIDVPPLDEEQT